MKKLLLFGFTTLLFGCVYTEIDKYSHKELDKMMNFNVFKSPTTNIEIKFRFFAPKNSEKLPLVVFLHGAGQRGDNNTSQLAEGDVGHIVLYSDKYIQSYVVAPQCPIDKEWIDADMIETLCEFIVECKKNLNVDTNRIYLTGFSMGGIGTWKVAQKDPTMFAAIMPVCGSHLIGRPYDKPVVPLAMKKLNVWAFNNNDDTVVDNIYAKNVLSELWNGTETKAHFTELTNKGHSDEYVYSSWEFMRWLYSQKK